MTSSFNKATQFNSFTVVSEDQNPPTPTEENVNLSTQLYSEKSEEKKQQKHKSKWPQSRISCAGSCINYNKCNVGYCDSLLKCC